MLDRRLHFPGLDENAHPESRVLVQSSIGLTKWRSGASSRTWRSQNGVNSACALIRRRSVVRAGLSPMQPQQGLHRLYQLLVDVYYATSSHVACQTLLQEPMPAGVIITPACMGSWTSTSHATCQEAKTRAFSELDCVCSTSKCQAAFNELDSHDVGQLTSDDFVKVGMRGQGQGSVTTPKPLNSIYVSYIMRNS